MARIEHRLGVAAPASVVWSIVQDVERWGEWNPVYSQARGRVAIGERFDLVLTLPGQKPMELPGRVLDWVPNEQLHWRIKLFGGAINVVRYIELEALTEVACVLSNGEVQSGVGVGLVSSKMRRAIRDGLQAMNEALKTRAEAQWRAQGGDVGGGDVGGGEAGGGAAGAGAAA